MAASNYKMVFGLTVFHSYYPDSICTDLQLVPDEATAAIFRKYSFRMVTRSNEWMLYCSTNAQLPGLLEYIQRAAGKNAFVFGLKSLAGSFTNYTDMPMGGNTGLSFSSSSTQPSSGESSAVLQPELTVQAQPMYLGTLTIRFQDLAAGGEAPPQYSIRFAARATQWQYYVVNKSGMSLNSPAVKGKQPVSFTGGTPVQLATGDAALLFSSSEVLPLSLVPKYQFDLVTSQGNTDKPKVIIKGLPNPAVAFLETVTISGKAAAASPVYVYI